MINKLLASIIGATIATSSFAGICDYRPSELIGSAGTAAVATGGTSVATVGMAGNAAGFYTLTHAATGATMLGSTLGGTSAAGTIGIMGGSAGVVGSTAAVLLAPATIVSAVVITGGVLAFEGTCFYVDNDFITDEAQILKIAQIFRETSDRGSISLNLTEEGWILGMATISTGSSSKHGDWDYYNLKNLYVFHGNLMHSDWGLDTVITEIDFLPMNQSTAS